MSQNLCFSTRRSEGFSLIELSAVLAIVGLIAGGIFAGRSLIRSSELKSVMTEARFYQNAMLQFRDAYNALPGDMNNASDFWGSFAGACATDSLAKTSTTCNGDGSHTIDYGTIEPVLVWQHLRIAKFIDGPYTAAPGTSGNITDFDPGENTPKSNMGTNNGWATLNMGTISGVPHLFDGQYDHVLALGSNADAVGQPGGSLSAGEMLSLDSKFDDGKAALGTIVTFTDDYAYTPECTRVGAVVASTSSDLDAEYNEASSGPQCALLYRGIME